MTLEKKHIKQTHTLWNCVVAEWVPRMFEYGQTQTEPGGRQAELSTTSKNLSN